jgi:hypothetical protein
MTKVMQPKVFFLDLENRLRAAVVVGQKSRRWSMIKNLDQSDVLVRVLQRQRLKGTGAEHAELPARSQPLSGQLLPGQDTPVTLSFCPKMETDFNFNLQVADSPKEAKPLTLNVKGTGVQAAPRRCG